MKAMEPMIQFSCFLCLRHFWHFTWGAGELGVRQHFLSFCERGQHKLLIFNCIKHAFESGKHKNLPRILTHLVWRCFRSVIAIKGGINS